MAEDRKLDPIPTDVSEFIDFFAESLADLRFPDVDGATLAGLAEDVRTRAAELARLEAQVAAARETLEQAQDELRRTAQRGLAYARVYADGNPALSERVAGLSLGRVPAVGKTAAKRGGRKRKGKEGEGGQGDKAGKAAKTKPTAELPFAESPAAAADAAASSDAAAPGDAA